MRKFSHRCVGGVQVDTAHASIICSCLQNSDVTLLTPVRAPRVLGNPVLNGAIVAVADDGNGVVDASSALAGNDTAAVVHESLRTSLDSNSNWADISDSSLKSTGAVSSDVDVTSCVHNTSDVSSITGSASGSVGVVCLRCDSGASSICESSVHPATIAAVVAGVTINPLLFGEVYCCAGLDVPH